MCLMMKKIEQNLQAIWNLSKLAKGADLQFFYYFELLIMLLPLLLMWMKERHTYKHNVNAN
jgi:hypothetical protein